MPRLARCLAAAALVTSLAACSSTPRSAGTGGANAAGGTTGTGGATSTGGAPSTGGTTSTGGTIGAGGTTSTGGTIGAGGTTSTGGTTSNDGTTGDLEIFVDGTSVIKDGAVPQAKQSFTNFRFGYVEYNGTNRTVWYDDVATAPNRIGCLK